MNAKSEPIQPYREALKKQIAFLTEAQKDAYADGLLATVLCYSDKILSLSKELERLENDRQA